MRWSAFLYYLYLMMKNVLFRLITVSCFALLKVYQKIVHLPAFTAALTVSAFSSVSLFTHPCECWYTARWAECMAGWQGEERPAGLVHICLEQPLLLLLPPEGQVTTGGPRPHVQGAPRRLPCTPLVSRGSVTLLSLSRGLPGGDGLQETLPAYAPLSGVGT